MKMTETAEERPELQEKLSELEILRQSLEESKTRERDIYDQLVRLTAEYQNFRKRTELRLSDARKAGQEDVLLQIISLADALTQAEESSRNAQDLGSLKKGLTLLKEQFEKFLSAQGLVAIKSKGEKLDPLRHEVIAQVTNADMEEGLVVDEIQKGYLLSDRVVRPARVRVSVKPKEPVQKNLKEEEEDSHV